jgi:hypothetical protein
MNGKIALVLVAATASIALAQTPGVTPSAPEVEICTALHGDVGANGNLISACVFDRDRKTVTIEGIGLTKLDLAAMCSNTLSALNSGTSVALDLKGAGTQPSAHTVCRIKSAVTR